MENYPNMPHVAGANMPHQPTMTMPYSYAAPVHCAPYRGNTFVLIVVLFILLIIVGATIYGKC